MVKIDNSVTIFSGHYWEGVIIRNLLRNAGLRASIYTYDFSRPVTSNPWSMVNVQVSDKEFDKAIGILAKFRESYHIRK
jgi:hypothetical protein